MNDIACGDDALILSIDPDMDGLIRKHLYAKLLDIKDDLCNIFLNSGNGGEFVKHAVNPDGSRGCSGQ